VEGKAKGIIFLSKLQPPETKTKTLRRTRLLNLISRNLDKKVILMCAGAGYGKTTLLSHFLSRVKIAYVYYHLEKKDAEPVVFFSYLIAGIRRLFPDFGKKIETLQPLFNYPQKYMDIVMGTFLNEMTETLTKDVYIILEDYHVLQPSCTIDKILEQLFVHMPPKLHFIITSRSKPDIPFSLMTTRDELFQLGTDQLKFTKEEIRRLFRRTYSISLANRDLVWIEKHSEGWPVSLRLMLQSTNYLEGIRSSGHARMLISNYLQSQVSLFNYFAQEIYFHEPRRMRDFMRDCSVFEWLSPGLCDAATGRKNSGKLLSELTKRNAFVYGIPEHGYRFHNLFRDFLYSKFTDKKRLSNIFLHAGKYLSRQGKYDEALQYFLLAGVYNKAIAIILKVGSDFVGKGRSSTLCSYIEQIPVIMRNKRPALLMVYTQALIQMGRLSEARRHLLLAVRVIKNNKTKRGRYAEALYGLGGINLNQGNFRAAKKYYETALDMCPKGHSLTRASILNSLGSLHNEMGGKQVPRAIGYFEQALRVTQRRAYKELEASILNNWAMSEWRLGNLSEAYAKLISITQILESHYSPGCGAGFFNAARLSLLLGYVKEAKSILDAGMNACSAFSDRWSMASIHAGYALYYQEVGDLYKAKNFGQRSLEICEKLGVDRLIINALNELCKVNTLNGNYDEAEQNIAAIWLRKKERDDVVSLPIHLTDGKLKTAQGKLSEAEEILSSASGRASEQNRIFELFMISMELSRIYYLERKFTDSIDLLRQAVEISRLKGYEYLLLKHLKSEKWMIDRIRERDICKEYVITAIKKSRMDIHWIDAFFFGVPRVVIDDHEIKDDNWRTLKAKKLFFYLMAHRNDKVTGDKLIDALWKNVSYRKGSGSLRKAMQHVRATLQSTSIAEKYLLSTKGVYQISPDVSVWLDIDGFQYDLGQAKSEGKEEDKITLLEKAIRSYGDGLAIGWYDQWVEELRNFYAGLYEECLMMIADIYFRRKTFDTACVWYRKLTSIDFYNEEYHRRLMMTYDKMGKLKEIDEDYKMLRSMLNKEFETLPQTETTELYSLIRRKRR
jgi:LuxR family maltose regulon positive regulatory protein